MADARCLSAYLEEHMMVLKNANAGDFDNAVKCNILKSIMSRKYVPVLANNNLVPYDTPDTYEARIQLLLLEVADNNTQVLRFLKSYLIDNFYTWMRIFNPAGINYKSSILFFSTSYPASQQQRHTISLEDMQKAIQNTLVQQKTKYQSLLEKQKTDFQSQMTKQMQIPVNEKMLPELSQLETYNELLPKLSLAICKICQSHIVQKKELKLDEWFSLLQYLHCNVNDLLITNSFLDNASEFEKGNSKYIFKSLGWYTDMPISIKNKNVQGILDSNKNQFQMKLHEKTYTILTFSKTTEVNEPEQQFSDMYDSRILAERCSQLTETKTDV
ncbi:6840_t:CDS:2 [Cetraspora pellucida]|uniref:6840_t:CDS:1 n=1 Tax=Cetraspora pellucida TaxID=1433469 RepID=A0A9N8W7S2_9GLOM|nr:6840_t:CDS:2 [Cetraspora pellucida]